VAAIVETAVPAFQEEMLREDVLAVLQVVVNALYEFHSG
jgi:hypothetical protein